MPEKDPLSDLLHSADAAASPPQVAAELPHRVRKRSTAHTLRARRRASAAIAIGVVLLISFVVHRGNAPIKEPLYSTANSAELADIRAKAEALSARIEGIERAISEHREQGRLAELAEEYKHLVANSTWLDPAELAIDQAAAIAICQGDFLWQEFKAREAATDAYRSVVNHFSASRWAAVADRKLSHLQMN